MPTIKLENVTKTYRKGRKRLFRRRQVEIGVADVDLTIRQGEFIFLIGSSGAGKSTLLNLICGSTKPDQGKVLVDGQSLTGLFQNSNNRAALMFGKVSQEPTLIRRVTVEENLKMAARIGRGRKETLEEMNARVEKVLGLVGMRGSGSRYPLELSIGENRRIELARALINSPSVLVLDEITANLDDDNIWDMFHLLTEINRKGTTVIMATHASQYVNIMRKRVITLVDGKIFRDVPKGRYGEEESRKMPLIF